MSEEKRDIWDERTNRPESKLSCNNLTKLTRKLRMDYVMALSDLLGQM